MKNNPFLDASYYTLKTRLCDKLEEIGDEWEIITDDGEKATDSDLYMLLLQYDLEEIYFDYIAEKEGDEFDHKTLHEVVERWVFLNG